MNSENTHGLSLKEILVVEDNPSDLKFMLDILTQAGYRVRPACDGELALRSVLAKHPDLILLDVKLPGIMGVEICRLLKSDPETKNIPVIFLSALGESELKVKALEAGGTDYITKPFESSEVLARIKVHLDLHRLQMDLAIKSEKLTEKIKEHRESEEALRISEEKFRTAFDAASDCIIIWDREYNYIYVNQSAMDYVGITSEQVIGKNIRDGQSHMPEFMRLWMSRVDLVVASGEELRVQDRTLIGERLFFTDSILSPLFASDGRVEAVYVAYRDITELKNAESSLRLMDFAFKSSLSADSLANTDGVLIHANPSFAKIWGY
ncbi:MAG: response regulator, partial [Gemmatimonadales bacterium]|nr:response regulator [Gemmatimonadales bacterium]